MVLVLASLVVLIVTIFAVAIHQSSEREVISRYKEHQLLHAQRMAGQIEFFFLGHSKRLMDFSSPGTGVMKQLRKHIRRHFRGAEKDQVDAVSVYDESGIVVYSTKRDVVGLTYGQCDFFSWAKKRESKGKVFVSPLRSIEEERHGKGRNNPKTGSTGSPPPDYLKYLLATPLYEDNSGIEGTTFVGVISFTVDLKEIFAKEMKDMMRGHHVWIIDNGGNLLFQSEYPEMVLNNIYRRDESCNACHSSFDYVDGMLKQESGSGDYRLRTSSKKIAGFASMKFENASWIVAVNTPDSTVKEFVARSLRGHLILLGVVVSVLAGSSILIYRDFKLRVKVQEAVKHWNEKQALLERADRSERDYRTIVETAHDLIWTIDAQGNFTFINPNGERVSGYQASELIGQNIEALIHPEDFARVKEIVLGNTQGRQGSFEARFFGKNGRPFFLSVNSVPLYENGLVTGLIGIGRDITEAKQAEDVLRESEKQLRSLSSQLLRAQEAERWRISSELHDELGQALSVMKLKIVEIEKSLNSDQEDLRLNCRTFVEYLRRTIEDVRRLSRDLSPSILKHLGLPAALRWLVREFGKNYNVKTSLQLADMQPVVSQEAQILVYRILQETLTNIGKHAEASQVSVVIQRENGHLLSQVADNGKGFDIKSLSLRSPGEKGLGLVTMKERVRMLGGSFGLWSEEGKGTRINFSIPIEEKGGANGALRDRPGR